MTRTPPVAIVIASRGAGRGPRQCAVDPVDGATQGDGMTDDETTGAVSASALATAQQAVEGQARDQAAADADQAASDADQAASERDAADAARDQRSADLDQVSADAHRGERSDEASEAAYASTRAARSASRMERLATHVNRAGTAEARLRASRGRDRTATRRDEAAWRRERRALAAEEAIAASDTPLGEQLDRLRKQAARDRADAAADRVLAAEERVEAAAERARLEAELNAAYLDDLTGTFRREMGREALTLEIDRARRADGRFVLAFVDVDGLKGVNDRAGHATGDLVLRTLVAAMRAQLRSYDPIVRAGGDEFVCGIGGVDLAEVDRRFGEIDRSLYADTGVRISVGLATLADDETLEQVTARADAALVDSRQSRPA